MLTTMTANQLLHKAMLIRELRSNGVEDNYVYIDDTVPNEAASDITLDNASESSLRNLSSEEGRLQQRTSQRIIGYRRSLQRQLNLSDRRHTRISNHELELSPILHR